MSCLSCVTIETGATPDETKESSEDLASRLRGEWGVRLKNATPKQAAFHLLQHYQHVTTLYLDYGRRVALEWQKGEEGRGGIIEDVEMREMTQTWIDSEKPILKAYDDNLEYGRAYILDKQFFQSDFKNAMTRLVDNYYKVFSFVFYPQGYRLDYEDKLEKMKYDSQELIDSYRETLKNY